MGHKEVDKFMYRRVNISVPDETLQLIDRVAAKGDRSRFIAEAVRHYVTRTSRTRLRKRLKEGALRRAARDRALAEDWVLLEEEAWRRRGR
jgi:CopG family transcriptional regulator/antitoxin EndoAI